MDRRTTLVARQEQPAEELERNDRAPAEERDRKLAEAVKRLCEPGAPSLHRGSA